MADSKSTTNDLGKFLQQHLMTGLLVIAAFVIGVLFTEVRYLKNGAPQPVANDTVQTVAMTDILNDAGVDADEVLSCYNDGRGGERVAAQQATGTAAGVTGTPGNFIVVNGNQGEALGGAVPFEGMKTLLDSYISTGKTENTTTLTGLPGVSEDDFVRGSADAKVTVIEYSDFDCPFCSRFHQTMEQVVEQYDGQVRWVFRHYPITSLHPNAENVARVSECVHEIAGKEKFWEFSDRYFEAKLGGAEVTI